MYCDAPRFLLRKFCALKLIEDLPRGEVLEIGCGAGSFTAELVQEGFTVKAIDLAAEAVEFCKGRLAATSGAERLSIEVADFRDLKGSFDAVFMFEVLEHLESDREALVNIHKLLKNGGHLLLSVPAHRKRFGPLDRVAGHYRRYDTQELERLLVEEGFEVEYSWVYGFPLSNLTEWVRNRLSRADAQLTMEQRTLKSGMGCDLVYPFRFLFKDIFLFPFYLFQMLFLKTEWGTGLIIRARRTS